MAVPNTNALNYLGKYVSFNHEDMFEKYGVISNVIFNMDGSVELSIGWDDFYELSKITNLRVLGEIKLY
ncbi:hypothetical protein KTI55_18305 [Acinetobacter ursingii]|uniref:hypothetical protein n=1 Tax=Acinetobacter ursingii TaxID=108980 RepID=UPI0021CD9D96|nr:hypothetical protein [Acinetobacter ursingii]MCU4498445.1 hypothetical protein [Acinetobacter ursingii]